MSASNDDQSDEKVRIAAQSEQETQINMPFPLSTKVPRNDWKSLHIPGRIYHILRKRPSSDSCGICSDGPVYTVIIIYFELKKI